MRKIPVTAVLAAVLFAACSDDPTAVETTASVRFFNATTGMAGSGAFTMNGEFASGSALAFGQTAQTCSRIDAGTTSFGFGAANPGGTGLSGNALATSSQTLSAGGNFTVIATGPATGPMLFVLDNTFSGSLGSSQAAVRFVNLTSGTVNNFNVLAGSIDSGPTTVTATNLAVGAPSTFATVSSGSNPFTILHGHDIALTGAAATLNLQGRSINTVAIVRNTSGEYQLINLPRCS